ncbi:MAG: tetraacyldisaccharide 4'-kinase [Gemmatimonadetes bacterium]|nr:tetraacyldisaccharide 4'-kinase [Gemmatimonadota bacterium]
MSSKRLSVGAAVGLVRAILPLARTWRLRHPDDPGVVLRPRLDPYVYYTWHENLLPLTCLFAGLGVATLASRNRDGEIIARVLASLGYAVARGSSSRGGMSGFRDLTRAAASGRPLILTSDGPRGPRRALKPGTARLAAATTRPTAAIGMASTASWRLPSWDRFHIPKPGATVFVAWEDPVEGQAETDAALGRRLGRQMARCEQAAREASWGRPPRVVRGLATTSGADESRHDAAAVGLPADGRSRIERRVRAAWIRDRPPVGLRAGAVAFGAARGVRNAAFDVGALTRHAASIPVVSVGGVTVGGSAKTPVTSAIARALVDRGHDVAIVTRGYLDELTLHARWVPGASVWGGRDRLRVVERAAAEGATCAVLDDGFQHRRLRRDLDVVLLDRDALERTNGALLPAGPFREPWREAARRADAVLVTGRMPWSNEIEAFDDELRATLVEIGVRVPVASLTVAAGEPAPANRAARAASSRPRPRLALTGIMKPNLFFRAARARCPSVLETLALPDHGSLDPRLRAGVIRTAGEHGVVMTQKDVARLAPALRSIPVWVLGERLVWHSDETDVWQLLPSLDGART